ncbi:MAG TPA: hypothetical protein VEQ41_05510 [Solirubrobacterales bacterium]|nr:hypothetical protein [Solirubrobacterales bacterium]
MSSGDDGSASGAAKKRCFVVSAFGSTAEEQRRYKQVLRHLVQKVLGSSFAVVRADEIDDEGLITNQIIEHLLDDDLVVADLTDLNPNVFYEVAVRHAARKPIVHLITKGQEIPFDVANMRAVQYALDDPDALEEAQEELRRKVQTIEENDWLAAQNPISAAMDVWLLRESEQPEVRKTGDLLGAVGELRDEVRSLARRIRQPDDRQKVPPNVKKHVYEQVRRLDPIEESGLADRVLVSQDEMKRALAELLAEEEIFLVDGKFSLIPF